MGLIERKVWAGIGQALLLLSLRVFKSMCKWKIKVFNLNKSQPCTTKAQVSDKIGLKQVLGNDTANSSPPPIQDYGAIS